jgi:hypothetical protein
LFGAFVLDLPIVVATAQSADKGRDAILFGIALAVASVWLYASERRALFVRGEGIKIVPWFGSATAYPWSRINGFYVRNWSRDESLGGRLFDRALMLLAAFQPNGGYYRGDPGGPTVMLDLQHQNGPAPLAITRRSPGKRLLVQAACDELNAARKSFG